MHTLLIWSHVTDKILLFTKISTNRVNNYLFNFPDNRIIVDPTNLELLLATYES